MNDYAPSRPSRRSASTRKRRETILTLLMGAGLSVLCVSLAGLALYLSGFNPFVFPSNLTATALAGRNASCRALIDQAVQASGNSCGDTGSNNVCYGNTTLKAEVAPNASGPFAERGDKLPVPELHSLSASPLDLQNHQWGIAVFKIIANLPRSLPGETVTLLVFGNTTLDNTSGTMEAFYFYSELGQIACEAVPFDGLLISSPQGSGIRLNINGAELTLLGDASLKATRNGTLEVSILRGAGRIVAKGAEQYFGAGQKVGVGLGGDNGVHAVSPPSAPEELTQAELNIACSLTGLYCSLVDVIPVSPGQAQQQILLEITSTPTSLQTLVPSRTSTPSATPTNTVFVLPRWTSTRTPTHLPTLTFTPSRTPTRTPRTLTPTLRPTRTSSPTPTDITPATPTGPTPTPTDTLTPTPTPPAEPLCGSVSLSLVGQPPIYNNESWLSITNSSGGDIIIEKFYADWPKSAASQKLDKLWLDDDVPATGVMILNISDNFPPSDIPDEHAWDGSATDRTILNAMSRFLIAQFHDDLPPPRTYPVHIVFDTGGGNLCQVVLP